MTEPVRIADVVTPMNDAELGELRAYIADMEAHGVAGEMLDMDPYGLRLLATVDMYKQRAERDYDAHLKQVNASLAGQLDAATVRADQLDKIAGDALNELEAALDGKPNPNARSFLAFLRDRLDEVSP